MATRKLIPSWVFLSLTSNAVLFLTVALLLLRSDRLLPLLSVPPAPPPAASPSLAPEVVANQAEPSPQQQLTYEEWVDLLGKEAKVAAQKQPDRLTILAGDSLSLWFPTDLLPSDRTWLNQGISGETATGLLKRLKLFDETQPQTIFVMVGINDLIRGTSDQELLEHYRQIIQTLQDRHPQAQIVVQSILPHGSSVTADSRDRLVEITNQRIHTLNQQLATIAREANVDYLNLHPLFVDNEGFLRSELTTDGLHLNRAGYFVWRSAIQTFSQLNSSAPGE